MKNTALAQLLRRDIRTFDILLEKLWRVKKRGQGKNENATRWN